MDQTISIGEQILNIKESKIKLSSKILPYLASGLKLKGDIKIKGTVHLEDQQLSQADILLTSNNFAVPPMNIMAFSIPKKLKIGNIKAKINLADGNNLNIDSLILGNEVSPIRASFHGPIKLNMKRLSDSELNIRGELGLSDSFLALPGFWYSQYGTRPL